MGTKTFDILYSVAYVQYVKVAEVAQAIHSLSKQQVISLSHAVPSFVVKPSDVVPIVWE